MKSDTVEFPIGARVWMKVSAETLGIITGILFREGGVVYGVTFADHGERWHYGFELTAQKSEAVA